MNVSNLSISTIDKIIIRELSCFKRTVHYLITDNIPIKNNSINTVS
jgi:hypothetical protein